MNVGTKLGRVAIAEDRRLATGPDERMLGLGGDVAFRDEVMALVHAILHRHYVSRRDTSQFESRRWGLTLEQLAAASVAQQVMKKIDVEYV